eukprot:TRINITY_DN800_c3_g1_i1.p1 TRINITY_DN800_c3_g1~~TRINITY_DN800_c3_g1_i1.p1  ORF type:complete len:2072 (+),score=446.86 TRINITY_DN800_c3_g1_i1:113-6328(+)
MNSVQVLTLVVWLLVAIPAVGGAQLRFVSGGVLSAAGNLFATENVPLPAVLVEVVDDTTGSRIDVSGTIRIVSPTAGATVIGTGDRDVVGGVARFSGITITDATQSTIRLVFQSSDSTISTLTTGLINVVSQDVSAYGIAFIDNVIPQNVTHYTPIQPIVAIEVVSSSHQPDATVSGGQVLVSSSTLGVTLVGAESTFRNGVASFPSLQVQGDYVSPIELTFTVLYPTYPNLHLKELSTGTFVEVAVKTLFSLKFVSGEWSSAGEVRTVDITKAYSQTVAIVDSRGDAVSPTSIPGTGTVSVSVDRTDTTLSSTTALIDSSSNSATFSIDVESYSGVLDPTGFASQTIKFSFFIVSDSFALPALETGDNPMFTPISKIQFLSVGSYYTQEGQTKVITSGQSIPDILVEIIDSSGSRTVSPPPGVQLQMTYKNNGVVQSATDNTITSATVDCPNGLCTISGIVIDTNWEDILFTFSLKYPSSSNIPYPDTVVPSLTSGAATVIIPAFNIKFGDVTSGSAVTYEGQPLQVNQAQDIPTIKVFLIKSDGSTDLQNDGTEITVTPTQPLDSSAGVVLSGNTQVAVVNGEASFSGLQLVKAISIDSLVFTVSTPGVPASGKSIRTGRVTVNGQPHHIIRWLPYPTGLVLNELSEVTIAVVDENGVLVNDQAFNAPTLSVSGVGISVGTWPADSNIQSIRITATDPPLVKGNTVTVTVTPVLSGFTFVPSALEIPFVLSASDNSVHHSSFIDPYSVPTIAKIGERQSVRVQFLDDTSSAAVDGDAGYTIVSEDLSSNSNANQLEMLPSTTAAAGGIQTLDFVFKGSPRDTQLLFTSKIGQRTLTPLIRTYRVVEGDATKVVISSLTPNPVAVGTNFIATYDVVDSEGNSVDTSAIEITPLITKGVDPPGDVSLIHIETDVNQKTLSLRFEGFLGDKSDLTITRDVTVRLSPTQQSSLSPAEEVVTITAGSPAKIEVLLLPVESDQVDKMIYLGKSTATQVLVTDVFGNLATGAAATDISIAPSSSSSVLFTATRDSVTSAADNVKIVRFTAGKSSSLESAQPGTLTLLYTPTLSGVTFNPSVVSVDFRVVVLLYSMAFNPLLSQSIVTSAGQPLTVRAEKVIASPGISLLMLDSDGNRYNGDPLQPDLSKIQVSMQIDSLPLGSDVIQGDYQVLFASGLASFNNFWLMNSLADAASSPRLRFTATGLSDLQTGVITLVQVAFRLGFAGSNAVNMLQPQQVFRYSALPETAVEVLDSSGILDLSLDGTYLIEQSTGLRALVTNGVAVFHRLTFQGGVGEQRRLTFVSEEKPSLKLESGLVSIVSPPSSIELVSSEYLVVGVSNSIQFKVVDESGQDMTSIPSTMLIEVASQNIIKTSQGITGGIITLPSTLSNIDSLTGGVVDGVFTPLLAFTPFSPINVRKSFTVCPGEVAAAVFREDTPTVLQLGVTLPITIDLVDAAGTPLNAVDYLNCAAARRSAGLYTQPPYPEQTTATLTTTTFFRQDGPSINGNSSITVPVIGTQETSTGTQGVFEFSLPGVDRLTRTFTVVKAQPSKIAVVSNSGGVVSSGSTLEFDIALQTVSGTEVTDQFAVVSIENSPSQGVVLTETDNTVVASNPFNVRATGPPRVENITFTSVVQGSNTQLTPTWSSIQVVYADAAGGTARTQWYQIFPNFEYASQTSFAADLTERLTLLSAAAPYCPITDICREINSLNVEVAPATIWPVPPVGNAIPAGEIPSTQAYVFRLNDIEQSHIERIEAALRLAHVDSTKFPQMRHHETEPVRFLGFLNLTASDVSCSSILVQSVCDYTAFCYWDSGVCIGSVCLQHGDEQSCDAEAQVPCVWDYRNDTNPKCIPERNADGTFAEDPLGSDWWLLLLLGIVLLGLCCCCALCFRFCCRKRCCKSSKDDEELPEGGSGDVQKHPPPPPPAPNQQPPVQEYYAADGIPQPHRDIETGDVGYYGHPYDLNTHQEVKQHNPPPRQTYQKAAPVSHVIPPSGQVHRGGELTEKERLEAALGDVNNMITYIDNNNNNNDDNYYTDDYLDGSPDRDDNSVLTVDEQGDVVPRNRRIKHTVRSPAR